MKSMSIIQRTFPEELQEVITQDFKKNIDALNDKIDEISQGQLWENFISYNMVLKKVNNPDLNKYIDAVTMLTLVTSGIPRWRAYKITFPHRCRNIDVPMMEKKAKSYLATNQYIKLIRNQMDIPMEQFFLYERFKAVNVLAEMMTDPRVGDRLRMEAADKLLARTEPSKDSQSEKAAEELVETTVNYIQKVTQHLEDIATVKRDALLQGKSLEEIQGLEMGAIDVSAE